MKNLFVFFVSVIVILCVQSCTVNPLGDQSKEILMESVSSDSLLDVVQRRTFQYFWEGAEPVSGMARERIHIDGVYPDNDQNIITTGGSGFGMMAILAGVKRGFISREEAAERFVKIIDFLKKADRYHGAWAHWINGETGKTKPFSKKDDGADIVETAFLMQGLLSVKQYLLEGNDNEKKLADEIETLWREVEWSWFTNNQNVIYWHWSPNYGWEMNHEVRGWNECLILYVLAASSQTFPVSEEVYHEGWARSGDIVSDNEKYGYKLYVKHDGAEQFGGPLFWAHYSFLGLDPRNLSDNYADYWHLNKNHTLINREWCVDNAGQFEGYSQDCWGLTASYSLNGYSGHAPGLKNDAGVISPTAALSSFPYTPEYSMDALKYFFYILGDKIFGKYGFYDAFSIHHNWYPQRYLAIDQGPYVVMIENYRSGLLWDYFMKNPDVKSGLKRLGFTYKINRKPQAEREPYISFRE